MLKKILLIAVLFAFPFILTACAGARANGGKARACEAGIKAGYHELDLAKADGFSGSVDWTKAASLLTAAKVQQQFEKYPNCIEKANRARFYIKRSKSYQ